MTKTPVIGIGLDAADPTLLEPWMDQGLLPNLARLRKEGTYGRLANTVPYVSGEAEFSSTEPSWVVFSTGCYPNKTGFWDTIEYSPESYSVVCDEVESGYDYKNFSPFYALGDDYRVAAFDIPVSALCDQVKGAQILGWGGHFPFVQSHSQPQELFSDIVEKHGRNPVLHNDNGRWWDPTYVNWIQTALQESIEKRVDVCKDLLQRDSWDLFLTTFGDTHSAGHDLYDQSQPDHPLHTYRRGKTDPLLAVYKKVDWAIGEILAAAPEDATVFCYSVHGIGANLTDLLSMFFLGEVMYRFNFPGKVGLAPGKLGTTPPPPIKRPIRRSWPDEVWRKINEPNPIKRLINTWTPKKWLSETQDGLASPRLLQSTQPHLGWMPGMAFSPLWPDMKAFALPAFADGHIRINLQGREGDGKVTPDEYDALCEDITAMLYELTDGRTGQPLVKKVLRTRQDPLDDNPTLPDADLVVVWHELPTDVVDSPTLGRIGPVTFNRPGGHRSRGFFVAKGAAIPAGETLQNGHVVDLAPTFLSSLGAPIPEHFDGKSLFASSRSKAITTVV
ncbi:nucleotide pyrophosphatase [Leptolyngbyaceae cyanobacterium CCMR0082]|uniref:Nucleotide pyrophosphatase n=1 Tax=Adonisia turfae CCMR0082 TaxID=2304604 RepID=A0A6M0SGS8_9CYAN|nr:alkaline phosphatase family protein [Adonisia turfae]NEZ67574.1 nucleotide pyrophosphatase [Adonisia turfae CCMR0082]